MAKTKEGCVAKISDHTGFYWSQCGRPVKEVILDAELCGIHARSVRIWQGKTSGDCLPYNVKPRGSKDGL